MRHLFIQHLEIHWTKKSRGGRMAQLRNQIPKAFSIGDVPIIFDKGKHFFAQKILFNESNEFQAAVKNEIGTPIIGNAYLFRNGQVTTKDDLYKIELAWNEGHPRRNFITKTGGKYRSEKIIDISDDGWSQVEFNARFTDIDGNWWYEQHIVNAAITSPDYNDIFLQTKPKEKIKNLSNLW